MCFCLNIAHSKTWPFSSKKLWTNKSETPFQDITLPFIKKISNHGFQEALEDDSHLRHGLNIHKGAVIYKAVADELGYKYLSAQDALAGKWMKKID